MVKTQLQFAEYLQMHKYKKFNRLILSLGFMSNPLLNRVLYCNYILKKKKNNLSLMQ